MSGPPACRRGASLPGSLIGGDEDVDIGVAENDDQREATYRFLNDEITAQHHLLMEEARGLDTKATVVAGFAAAAVSFLRD